MIEIWYDLQIGKDGLHDRDIAERRKGKVGKTLSRTLTWQGSNIFVARSRPSQLAGAAQ